MYATPLKRVIISAIVRVSKCDLHPTYLWNFFFHIQIIIIVAKNRICNMYESNSIKQLVHAFKKKNTKLGIQKME